MKWTTKIEPSIGDLRSRRIFAFLPHKCEDGYTRWFERIWTEEEFVEYSRISCAMLGGLIPGWTVRKYF
jgi:hypothetical protein